MSAALFLPDRDHPGRYHPTEATVGPWSAEFQHGGPPIALLAHALAGHPAAVPMELARLTVEFLGPVPLDPCQVSVRVVRPGKRIELLQATYAVDGRAVLSAHAWRMRREPGICPAVPDRWEPPTLPPPQTTRFFGGTDGFPFGHCMEWRFVQGGFDRPGAATVWGRLRVPLILEQEPNGLESLLALLDSANGVSAELDISHWSFVPVDLSLNLVRLPVGPWVGMTATTVIDSGGIGLVKTRAFDACGALGASLHTLFVRPR